MKKIGILIENLFNEEELIYPYHRMREENEVLLIGTKGDEEYSSKAGYKMKSDIASADIKADELDALVIPGGFSPDFMRRCDETVKLVKELSEQNKPIAAICHGPWMLATAVDLNSVNVTSFYSIKKDLENAGAIWEDSETVVSKNIITARNPNDLPMFIKAFIEKLNEN